MQSGFPSIALSYSHMTQLQTFTPVTQRATPTRLIELDWLRVLVFGLLILYHTGMLYAAGWGWHYKSTYTSKLLTNIMLWSNQWRMSLLFLISGAAVSFQMAKQPLGQFIRKRTLLLLLPLLFGVFVIVVPQVYVEAHSKNLINSPSYWHFWYIYLDQTSDEFAPHKTLGPLHLTWNHLWFLPYILAYTLILWVLYPAITSRRYAEVWQWFNKHASSSWVIFIPVILFYGIGWWLYEKHPTTNPFATRLAPSQLIMQAQHPALAQFANARTTVQLTARAIKK